MKSVVVSVERTPDKTLTDMFHTCGFRASLLSLNLSPFYLLSHQQVSELSECFAFGNVLMYLKIIFSALTICGMR